MKTVFNHCTIILSNIQPFEKLLNFQFLNSSISSSKNHCCCISLPLKIIKRYKYRPLAEIYLMIIVYSYRPGSFLKVLTWMTSERSEQASGQLFRIVHLYRTFSSIIV